MASQSKVLKLVVCVCIAALTPLLSGNASPAEPKHSRPLPSVHGSPAATADRRAAEQRVLRRRVLNGRPLAMYYYYDDTRAFESLQAHSPGITVLAPQCFWIDKEGIIQGAVPSRVREVAQRDGVPIMPLVFNKGFDRATVTAMLHSPTAQARAVSYMTYLANRDNDVGFQIDLENIDPADQQLFTQFVKRVASRLHRDGRLLSVAVTPRFSNSIPRPHGRKDAAGGGWSAAFDYRALGASADFLTLMTYDHSSRTGPPGPIAGYAWMQHAVDYAVQRVPRERLLLGIPLYGREWTVTNAVPTTRSLTYQEVRTLLERPETRSHWDVKWRSPWFEYRDGPELRTVWYEDARSLKEKLNLMREYKLRGFAAWRLGDEGSEFWSFATGGKSAERSRSDGLDHTTGFVRRKAKSRAHQNVKLSSQLLRIAN